MSFVRGEPALLVNLVAALVRQCTTVGLNKFRLPIFVVEVSHQVVGVKVVPLKVERLRDLTSRVNLKGLEHSASLVDIDDV